MYGPDEHRNTLARINGVAVALDSERDRLSSIRGDLHIDDEAVTRDAREHLRAASLLLVRACKACDEAVESLPAPAARVDTAQAVRDLHGGL